MTTHENNERQLVHRTPEQREQNEMLQAQLQEAFALLEDAEEEMQQADQADEEEFTHMVSARCGLIEEIDIIEEEIEAIAPLFSPIHWCEYVHEVDQWLIKSVAERMPEHTYGLMARHNAAIEERKEAIELWRHYRPHYLLNLLKRLNPDTRLTQDDGKEQIIAALSLLRYDGRIAQLNGRLMDSLHPRRDPLSLRPALPPTRTELEAMATVQAHAHRYQNACDDSTWHGFWPQFMYEVSAIAWMVCTMAIKAGPGYNVELPAYQSVSASWYCGALHSITAWDGTRYIADPYGHRPRNYAVEIQNDRYEQPDQPGERV